ncbi:MAG TPA: penicillin-binding transpeptidase domain-containing protein [Longilinea sp.]|nr:penicillin-binding transpeptidase domain-containing protein [Longilinea sp.]
MRQGRWLMYLLIASIILTSCGSGTTDKTATPAPTATSSLPTPPVGLTPAPDAKAAAQQFLDAWQGKDYPTMYAMLSGASKDALSETDFTKYYTDATSNLTLTSMDVQVLSSLTWPSSAQVAYQVTFHTGLLGDIQKSMQMNLALENGNWRVQWNESLVMPELKPGYKLLLDEQWPERGNIYDSAGNIIATNTDAYALAVIPGQIANGQYSTVVTQLSRLTGKSFQAINIMIQNATSGAYVAVGEAPAQTVESNYDLLSNLGGLVMTKYSGRYYFDQGIAPQAVGYMLAISPDDLNKYQAQGYRGDEQVGYAGLESWAEKQLAGRPSASLYVVDSSGAVVTRLAQVDAVMPQDVYTTLNTDLQLAAQQSLDGFTGAVVVMERNTGRVLAMASSPSIDPNLYNAGNYNRQTLFSAEINNGGQLNRATQGVYPLGSVFKVIVMAAALESGLYNANTTYNCGSEFTELPDVTLYDWTYMYGDPPSGVLTLPQGLMRSCDPYFYHIALDLFRQKGANFVSDIAKGFGLGSPTGIDEVAEGPTSVPVPASDGDAVQQGIGQGALQVTPLQVADFIAAVGNGGTLYRPQIVDKIATSNGQASFQFSPEVRGTLPVSAANLKIIQDAMHTVITDQRGTAHKEFLGLNIRVFGKTGTASVSEDPNSVPHAWFAGYTDQQNQYLPDIAIAVVVENSGEGSEVAAPIFRRMVEVYNGYTSLTLFPWESQLYVTKTPTPETTPTASGQ